MNIVITGISKGIGLALTEYALKENHQVYGVARNPEKSPRLLQLQKDYPSLHISEVELTDENAGQKLLSSLNNLTQVDVLINNAGVYENDSSKMAFMKSFEINSYIPFMVTNLFLPKLKNAKNPRVIHITSLMGSISDNTSGNSFAYRASKSALNMIHKCLSIDNPWLISAAIHPGWVKTDMGGESAPLAPEAAAFGIWTVINQLDKSESGCFKDYQGRSLPW